MNNMNSKMSPTANHSYIIHVLYKPEQKKQKKTKKIERGKFYT